MTAMRQPSRPGIPQTELTRDIYDFLLEETRAVARQLVDRLRALNARFPSTLPSELLAHLQTSFLSATQGGMAGRPSERRRALRFPSRGERVRIAAIGSQWGAYDGLLLDQSWKGLLLLSPEPFEVGSMVAIHPRDLAEGGVPQWAEVRHCLRREDGWAVGGQKLMV
jgi:hypothetical protein